MARTIASAPPVSPTSPADAAERSVWASLEGCQQIVAAGGRMHPREPFLLRVATWNIRWFPRGCPSNQQCPQHATDIPWLACTIAWMHVDILALQEILATPDADFSLNAVRSELHRLTGSSWEVALQSCGSASDQHVGFLWNSTRVTLQQMTDVWELNGAATSRDYEHRRRAAQRIGQIAIGQRPILQLDHDVLVLGDSNTMGQAPPHPRSAAEELQMFDQELAPAFRRLPMTPNCTEYHERKGGALDHLVVSAGMQEVAATARVTGYCAVAACENIAGPMPAAYERLSDHCPVVVDIQDRDLD